MGLFRQPATLHPQRVQNQSSEHSSPTPGTPAAVSRRQPGAKDKGKARLLKQRACCKEHKLRMICHVCFMQDQLDGQCVDVKACIAMCEPSPRPRPVIYSLVMALTRNHLATSRTPLHAAQAHWDALAEMVHLGTTRLVAADTAAAKSGSESPPFWIPDQAH